LLLLTPLAWAGAKEDYLAAGQAMRQGDHDQALRLYESVVNSPQTPKPALARAYHMMGTIHTEKKQWEEAYANFATSLKFDPDNALAYLGMGRACQGERRWQEAINEYTKAIELRPDLDMAYYFRGNAWKELGQTDKAQADLRKARDLKTAAAAEREPVSAQDFYQRANHWGRQRQYAKALDDLDQAISLQPDYTHAHFNRALTLAHMGRLPEAVTGYTKVLELDPGYLPVYNDRGRLLLKMGRIKEAVADFDQAVNQDKDQRLKAYGLHNRGNARAAMEQYLAAADDYTQAMALGYKPWDLFMARGESYRLGRQYEKALADYAQAKQAKPGQPDPYLFSALTLAALERYPEALAELDQALKIKPGWREANAAQGQMLFLNAQFAEAARVMEPLLPTDLKQRPTLLLWLYLARERSGQPSRDWLTEQAQDLDLSQWPGVIINLFLGQATPQDVNRGYVTKEPQTVSQVLHMQNQAYFFLSQYYLLRNIPNDARINLEHCIRHDMRETGEYLAARAELERMGPKPEKKPRKSKSKQ
jgi:tetratricopeptide (TPR) repeat protein